MAISNTFAARENNLTANNNFINLNDSTYNILITSDFNGDGIADGDLALESGGIDPDTWVYVDFNGDGDFDDAGEGPFQLTFEGTGVLPNDSKVPVDLQGSTVTKIIIHGAGEGGSDLRVVFFNDADLTIADWARVSKGNIPRDALDTTGPTYVCFVRGTQIMTPNGTIPVERLGPGDTVTNHTGRVSAIRWVGSRKMTLGQLLAAPNSQPTCVPAGAMGGGLPLQDLWVSPNHRLLIHGHLAETLFGEDRVLVAAKHLEYGGVARVKTPPSEVEYFHVLLDRHDILIANGTPAESLFLGDQAQTMISDSAVAEIEAKFPRETHPEIWAGKVAARTLNAKEARVLSEALRKSLQNARSGPAAA